MLVANSNSIYSAASAYFGGARLFNALSRAVEREVDAQDETSTSTMLGELTTTRYQRESEALNDVASTAQEIQTNVETLSTKLSDLRDIVDEYHYGDDQTAEHLAELSEQFDSLKAEITTFVVETEVVGKSLFAEGTSYTFKPTGAVGDTYSFSTGLDAETFAVMSLSDDAEGDLTGIDRVSDHVSNHAIPIQATVDRLTIRQEQLADSMALATETSEAITSATKAEKLSSLTRSQMSVDLQAALFAQANLSGEDAYFLLQ